MKKRIFTDKQIKQMIKMYENNVSLNKIGKAFNTNNAIIKRVLIERDVKIRQRTLKYNFNIDYFNKIDSEEKAYWLGFLAADGNIYKNKQGAGTISLISNIRDIEHLRKFLKAIEAKDVPIITGENSGYGKGTIYVKIVLYSNKMMRDLIDKGVIERKSLILKPPTGVPSSLTKAWIRGYFDGDGTIFLNSNGNYTIGFCGTKEVLCWIKEELGIVNKLEKRKHDETNNFYIRVSGTRKPYLIICNLYAKSNIFLDRKYKIFNQLKSRLGE